MKAHRQFSAQAMVEFALVFPLILLIIIVFIDLGRVIYFHSALTNAVREGARYAIVTQFSSSTDRATTVRQKVVDFALAMPLAPTDVTVYCDQNLADLNNPCDDYVTVSAQAQIAPMISFVAQIIGGASTFNVSAESTMQMTPYGAIKP